MLIGEIDWQGIAQGQQTTLGAKQESEQECLIIITRLPQY